MELEHQLAIPHQPKKKKQTSGISTSWLDNSARYVLILPAVLIVLVMAIFPLLVSLYLSFSRFKFVRGGFEITFIGLANYNKLFFGSEQRHLLGKFAPLTPLDVLVMALAIGGMLYLMYHYGRSERFRLFGLVMRVVAMIFAGGLLLMLLASLTLAGWIVWALCVAILFYALFLYTKTAFYHPLGVVVGAGILIWLAARLQTVLIIPNETGLPGTLGVTLLFVLGGVTLQYFLGLGLGLLLTQNLPGKRFFRVVFLLPMMITPVGIGFLFKMMTDTLKGPFSPVWIAAGLGDFAMLGQGDTARLAVVIGDTWQWTPFVFIILLAALEGISKETIEAALVDGANRFQMFRYLIVPEIIPVSTTVILIRLIESFKLIDMPNILTGGGPGTSTETLTLQAYVGWRSGDLGGSAALAYILLIVATFCALVFVNFIRRRLLDWVK